MKRLLPLLCFSLATQVLAASGDNVREIQTELKNQGFYYGEVTGKESPELNAAIRRYQIRNGLEVTGDLSAQTLRSLGFAAEDQPRKTTPPASPSKPDQVIPPTITPSQPAPPASANRPPVNLRREQDDGEEDREFLRREETRRQPIPGDRSIIRPPAPLDGATGPSEDYIDLFAGTPYATAPKVVQEETLRRVQTVLAKRGFYRDEIDGSPGPHTEEAILAYQRSVRLPLTGRLDLQTLSQFRLLPGRGTGNPPMRPFNPARGRSSSGASEQQVYRGVWVE